MKNREIVELVIALDGLCQMCSGQEIAKKEILKLTLDLKEGKVIERRVGFSDSHSHNSFYIFEINPSLLGESKVFLLRGKRTLDVAMTAELNDRLSRAIALANQ